MYSATQNTYIHKNESKHSEMGPATQNPIRRTVRSVHMCVHCTDAHNIAQNKTDNFPPYPPDNHHCSDDVYLREGRFLPTGQTDFSQLWSTCIVSTTSMYSLTFCVRVMSPERHHWKPAVQAAAVMLRTPPSPAGH